VIATSSDAQNISFAKAVQRGDGERHARDLKSMAPCRSSPEKTRPGKSTRRLQKYLS
jgi:hypothetical protein